MAENGQLTADNTSLGSEVSRVQSEHMRRNRTARLQGWRAIVTLVLLSAMTLPAAAGTRRWQTGTWCDARTRRTMVDFGPGATSFDGRQNAPPQMRAMADIRTFIIETGNLRLEIEEVVAVGRPWMEVTPGTPVTFALEKNSVYVRDADGKERKLRLKKKLSL